MGGGSGFFGSVAEEGRVGRACVKGRHSNVRSTAGDPVSGGPLIDAAGGCKHRRSLQRCPLLRCAPLTCTCRRRSPAAAAALWRCRAAASWPDWMDGREREGVRCGAWSGQVGALTEGLRHSSRPRGRSPQHGGVAATAAATTAAAAVKNNTHANRHAHAARHNKHARTHARHSARGAPLQCTRPRRSPRTGSRTVAGGHC